MKSAYKRNDTGLKGQLSALSAYGRRLDAVAPIAGRPSGTSYAEQAGILLWGKVLSTTVELALPLLLVRLLGKAEVGILAALLLVYSTVSLVLKAGLPNALMWFLPKASPGERRTIAWRVAALLLGMGAVASTVFWTLAGVVTYWPHAFARLPAIGEDFGGTAADGRVYFFLLALYPLVDMPAQMLPNLLVVENRAKAAAGVGVVKALGSSLAFLLPLLLGAPLWMVLLALVCFGYLYGGVLLWYLVEVYRGQKRAPTKVGFGTLLRFGLPLGATDIVAKLNTNVDRYLILSMFPAAVFAEYHAGAWQIPLLTSVAFTVATAYTPRLTELFKEGKAGAAIELWQQTIYKVGLVVVPLAAVVAVAAEETMELLFTADYIGGAPVLRYYAILTLGRVAAFGPVIVAAGRTQYVFRAIAFSFLANITISVPLALALGFEGPALGTVLAFIPTVFIYCWAIARSTGMGLGQVFPLRAYLQVVGLTALAAVPAIAFKFMVVMAAGVKLALIGLILLGVYSVAGTIGKIIKREDWRYLVNWFSLKNVKT